MSEGTEGGPPVIVWFRQDLRLQDHAALHAALEGGRAVLPIHVLDDDTPGALAREVGAVEVHAGRMHEPWAREAETAVAAALRRAGATLRLHRTATLFDLDGIRTKAGGVYGVYAPFARTCRALGAPAPERVPCPAPPRSDWLEDWGLLPARPGWAAGFREIWQVGKAAAHDRLAGVELGRSYPHLVADLPHARQRALDIYRATVRRAA